MLVVQFLIIFVAAPFAAAGYTGSREAMELLLFASAFLTVLVCRGRMTTTIAAIAMIIFLTGSSFQILAPSAIFLMLTHTGSLGATLVVTYVVGRAVFGPGVVTPHRILGAIVMYLNFGMIFTTGYRLLWDLIPNSLTGIQPGIGSWQASGSILYFSFVTLTTVGFGDIVPLHPFVRGLANLEAVIGQLYPATVLARLITLELEARRQ